MSADLVSVNINFNTAQYSDSTEIQVTIVAAKNESVNVEAKAEKQVRVLVPTEDEPWAKIALWQYQKVALVVFRATFLKSFLEKTSKKFTENTWKKIQDLSIGEMQTFGDIERAALIIINASDKSIEAKEETHKNMKKFFKVYAEDGYTRLMEVMRSFKR